MCPVYDFTQHDRSDDVLPIAAKPVVLIDGILILAEPALRDLMDMKIYVETDADRLFIALSPYFVPLWMLCWLGGVFVLNYFWPFEAYEAWFYGGLGFWWVFHSSTL